MAILTAKRSKTLSTARDVKMALRQLPPNLDQTYDRILLNVQPAHCQYLRRALRLVVFSCRPLTLAEVAEAVIIEPDAQEIDEDDRLLHPHDLLDMGGSLLAPAKSTGHGEQRIELSHYSVKEYLLSVRAASGPGAAFALNATQAEIDNRICCLTYLGLDVFQDAWRDFDSKTWKQEADESGLIEQNLFWQHKQRLKRHPFLAYAARYCFHYCKGEAVQIAVAPIIRKILSAEKSGSFRTMTYTCAFKLDAASDSTYERVFRYSLISVAAHYGLEAVVKHLLDRGTPADYITSRPLWIDQYPEGQTALCRAANSGHERLCKTIIDAGASVHGATSTDCPLSAAARSGSPSIVRMMLDAGADVERDAKSLAETLLAIWWRFAEGNTQWRDVLNVSRDAGAKWSTIDLLAAFSKTLMPLVRHAGTVLGDTTNLDCSETHQFECVIAEMDTPTLDALQWLAQEKDGADGFKASVAALLRAVYESQPHLILRDPTRLVAQNFSAEEVIAENLIRFYFHLTSSPSANPSGCSHQYEILDARWENIWTTASSTGNTVEKPHAESQLGVWALETLHRLWRDTASVDPCSTGWSVSSFLWLVATGCSRSMKCISPLPRQECSNICRSNIVDSNGSQCEEANPAR